MVVVIGELLFKSFVKIKTKNKKGCSRGFNVKLAI